MVLNCVLFIVVEYINFMRETKKKATHLAFFVFIKDNFI